MPKPLLFTARQTLFILLILGLFFLFSYHYASQINLWGDEVASILRSQGFWLNIVHDHESHLPTYFLFLKLLLGVIDVRQELFLRLLHIIPFLIGLWFGCRIIMRLFNNYYLTIFTLVNALVLPNFIFYATNLRMYTFIFMFSMIYLELIINAKKSLTFRQGLILLFMTICFVFTDYASLIYYLPCTFFLLINKYYRAFWLNSLAGFLLLIWLIIDDFGDIQAILAWPVSSAKAIEFYNPGLWHFFQLFYLSFRPGLDLIYPASLPIVIAAIFPGIILVIYFISVVRVFLTYNQPEVRLILFLSGLWLLVSPTGYSFTRLFLPSQLLMLGIMGVNLFRSQRRSKIILGFFLGILLIINLQQAIQPTLRLYSLIDYEQIAIDLAIQAEKYQVNKILLSNNSLNLLSIEYYLKGINQDIKILRFTETTVIDSDSFIFVSHMTETSNYVDVRQLSSNYTIIGQYLELDDLPYNYLWKTRLVERTNQPYVIETYLLEL